MAYDIHEILAKYWGYTNFRPLQEDIIRSALTGHDTLALMPTGGGKSLCFQVPALALDGICIVISPLIALMKDQVEQLQRRKIKAIALHSGMDHRQIDIALDNCIYGQVKFLYVSPERLKTEIMLVRAAKMKVNLLAVDEAHCISQWGYDFRPPYLEIAAFRESTLPNVPCIALTATATRQVKADIQEKLGFRTGSQVFSKSFARPNLSYSAFYEENKQSRLLKILQKVPGSSVVYVGTRKKTLEISKFLTSSRISADHYHGGLTHKERNEKQERWISGNCRVMVATNAFGMGIDKPDVRTVVHLDMPATLEAYYQEAGRAGRDGNLAYAVLLYHQADLEELTKRIGAKYPTSKTMRRVYQALANYLKIAVGSGFMEAYDLQLEDFINTFNLDFLETYFALKRLEDLDFIQFNENFFMASRAMINVGKEALYSFNVAHKQLQPTLEVLLRMYGGELFSNFVAISEAKLAEKLKLTPRQVTNNLTAIKDQGVLLYEPKKETAQVTFSQERQNAATMRINEKWLKERKGLELGKAQAVTRYATDNFRCRTLMLLEYFDEAGMKQCGNCDHCRSKNHATDRSGKEEQAWKLLKEMLSKQPQSFKSLSEQGLPGLETSFVRDLIAAGMLILNEKGEIQLAE